MEMEWDSERSRPARAAGIGRTKFQRAEYLGADVALAVAPSERSSVAADIDIVISAGGGKTTAAHRP